PDQQDVALLELQLGVGEMDPLEVVVDRYGKGALGAVLPNHVLGKDPVDLLRLGNRVVEAFISDRQDVAPDDVVAEVDALDADAAMETQDEFGDLIAWLAAEDAAAHLFTVNRGSRHVSS